MKKIFAMVAVIMVAVLVGCSARHDGALVGVWRWYVYGDYAIVFNADGTGVRGFSDEADTFRWSTRGGRLNISSDMGIDEQWGFIIEGDRLVIDNQHDPYMVYDYLLDSQGQDEALVGEWEYDGFNFVYTFYTDGTGSRGMEGQRENFTWSTTGERLVIHAPELRYFEFHWERWTYTIDGEVLMLVNQDDPGLVFRYTLRP